MLLKLCLVCYINRNGCNKLNKIIATFKPHFDNSEFTIFLFHLLPPRSLFSLLQFRQHVECKEKKRRHECDVFLLFCVITYYPQNLTAYIQNPNRFF